MPGFVMWNTQRKALDALVLALADEHLPDVLLLVERAADLSALEREMASRGFALAPSEPRFALFHRTANTSVERLFPPGKLDREDHWRIRWGRDLDLLLVGVHGPDRVNFNDLRRGVYFGRLCERIRWLENLIGHGRTVVMGDFNANPFEPAMAGAVGLHALPVTHVGGREWRAVLRTDYPFFYNPMWKCYGKKDGPLATHYFNGSDFVEIFWHMLDQVVIRPCLVPQFPENRLRILTGAGAVPLLDRNGHPDDGAASDHFPLVFRINHPPRR